MATIREQIAWHTRAEATQQQPIADDPLAPTPIRFTQQQAHATQAYPPDYEDADDYTAQTRPPRSAMRYQHTLPHQYRGQVVLPPPPQHLRRHHLTGQPPGPPQRPPRQRPNHSSFHLPTR